MKNNYKIRNQEHFDNLIRVADCINDNKNGTLSISVVGCPVWLVVPDLRKEK